MVAAAMCVLLILVPWLRTGTGLLLPLGEGGSVAWLAYWSCVAVWLTAGVVAWRGGRWRRPPMGAAAIAVTLLPSIWLMGVCMTGDCF